MPSSPLGSYIQELLEARNWTQQDLEAHTGITNSTLSRIMNGQEPRPSQLARIARALEIAPARLMLVMGHDIDPVPGIEPDERRAVELIRGMPELMEIFDLIAGLSTDEREVVRAWLQALHLRRRRRHSPPPPSDPPAAQ